MKAVISLPIFCLFLALTYDVANTQNDTKKCIINEIPNKIKVFIAQSPRLQSRKNSGKWIALDYIIDEKDVVTAYKCISEEMLNKYQRSKLAVTFEYRNWIKVNNASFFAPANNFGWANVFVNKKAEKYKANQYISDFDRGSTIDKESFVFDVRGNISVGPLFYMVKMQKGFNKHSNDWKFVEVNLDGTHVETSRKNMAKTQKCIICHGRRMNSDYLYFIKSK